MQEGNAWFNCEGAAHVDPETVKGMLDHAAGVGANLLLNAAPRGDGSIHPEDRRTLLELGRSA
jgi:alpha-L-fucosidase